MRNSWMTLAWLALGACRTASPEPENTPAAEPVVAEKSPPSDATAKSEAEATPASTANATPPSSNSTALLAAGDAVERSAEGGRRDHADGASSSASPAASSNASLTSSAGQDIPVPPGHRRVRAKPVAPVTPRPGDPLAGIFTLQQATAGLTGKGKLVAEIATDAGKLECELYEDRAPITVANFVGLARGLRPWKSPDGEWVKKPGYDGTSFHRVIKGFMIQGGDPAGSGKGEPGYVIPDEVWEGAYHSERGLICMANRGPNTNGMQFFIMDGSAPHLDSGYTIFGKCGPDSVIEKLAASEVQGDRALNPPKIKRVTVRRKATKKPQSG